MNSGLPIDIQALLSRGGIETLRIEYKAEWNHVCGESALRTICAFANDLANVNGGYVVFGVEERDGQPVLPVRGIPKADLERIQKEIQGNISKIRPTYSPMIVPERVGEAWILVVVCPGGDARPYEAPETLGSRAARHAYVRTNNQTREAKGDLLRQLHEVSAWIPFDDRARYDAEVNDLSPALVRHHLHLARSRLAEDGVETHERYRKMQLLKRVNSHEVPRNVALLFFSEDPRRWFRGALIEIAQLPGGREGTEIIERTINGPLASQIRTALDHLRGLIPVDVRKHADRAEADRVEAWPFAAVEEALVNAVHHRGYDLPDPIKVEILPEALRIVSYPGPVAGLSFEDLQAGDPPPVPARNRRIAELLKDLELAEARGTGLPRIRKEMERNGSPPPVFRFDPDRTWFEVTLPIHPTFLRRENGEKGPLRSQPLRLGRPAPPEEVVGRDELVGRILRTLESQSVLLVGPPGRGVSSVLRAVEATLARAEAVFAVDCAGVNLDGFISTLLAWDDERRPQETRRSSAMEGAARSYDEGPIKSDDALGRILDALGPSRMTLMLDNVHLLGVGQEDDVDWERVHTIRDALLDSPRRNEHLRLVASVPNDDDGRRWSQLLRPVAIPPLDGPSSKELASRLLRGCHLGDDPTTAEALAEVSAGWPELLVRLVAHLREENRSSAEAAYEALDALAVDPSDPAGFRDRILKFNQLLKPTYDYLGNLEMPFLPFQAGGALFDAASADPQGRSRLDIIASAASRGFPRLEVVDALVSLELGGWLVTVEGRMRVEHPWIRDAWLKFRAQTPPPRVIATDIPF